MQSVGPLTTDHLAARVLIDDHNAFDAILIRRDDIITIAHVDGVRTHGLLAEVGHVDVVTDIETRHTRIQFLRVALRLFDAIVGKTRSFLVEFDFVELLESITTRFTRREFFARRIHRLLDSWHHILLARIANIAFARGDLFFDASAISVGLVPF